MSRSTISTRKKNKHKIEPLFNANILKSQRMWASNQEQVDQALLQWFKLQRNQGIPINGPKNKLKLSGHFVRRPVSTT